MKDVFTKSRQTSGFQQLYALFDPFRMIELTNATHAEDSMNEWVVHGERIGYAFSTSTYSGGDTQRGTYNASESFTTRDQVHLVFDFPTHAANGTFQSIYFNTGGENNEIDLNSEYESLLTERNGFDYHKSIGEYNNELYSFKSNYNNQYLYKVDPIDLSVISSIDLGADYDDFTIVGDTIYFIVDGVVHSATMSNPSNATLVKDTGTSSDNGITYEPNTDRWYTAFRQTISVWDSAWNLLSTITDDGYFYGDATMYGNIFTASGGIITSSFTFITAGGEYDGEKVSLGNVNGENALTGVVGSDFYIVYDRGGYDDTEGTHRKMRTNIGSRTLLDSPVTKSATSTMKITYDFMLG
jgi:hypothetical protein